MVASRGLPSSGARWAGSPTLRVRLFSLTSFLLLDSVLLTPSVWMRSAGRTASVIDSVSPSTGTDFS